MSEEGKVVCVTGASGFVASWLVKFLLARRYSVHATVRSLNDPKKTEHLLAFDGAKERLSLFEANLTEEGSFDSAVNGCVCIFHTASPVSFSVSDPQVELIDPAVKGTLNVLRSAAKVSTLKRVILTSSIASVWLHGLKLPESCNVVDETWFSDPVICEQRKTADVREVATAHIQAFEKPEANGRYCMVGSMIRSSEIMKIVGKLYPALAHSESKCDDALPYSVSRAKAEDLGVDFTAVEVSIKDTIENLIEKKLLTV